MYHYLFLFSGENGIYQMNNFQASIPQINKFQLLFNRFVEDTGRWATREVTYVFEILPF